MIANWGEYNQAITFSKDSVIGGFAVCSCPELIFFNSLKLMLLNKCHTKTLKNLMSATTLGLICSGECY